MSKIINILNVSTFPNPVQPYFILVSLCGKQ